MNKTKLPYISYRKLKQKLKDSGVYTEAVRKAISIAVQAHINQIRDSGNPYLEEHIFYIAFLIAEDYYKDQDLELYIICALLHDVLEDSNIVKLVDIKRFFGNEVAKATRLLTKKKSQNLSDLSQDQKYTINKLVLEKLKNNKLALVVKLYDRLANIKCITESTFRNNPPKYKRYVEETEDNFVRVSREEGFDEVSQLLNNEVKRVKKLL